MPAVPKSLSRSSGDTANSWPEKSWLRGNRMSWPQLLLEISRMLPRKYLETMQRNEKKAYSIRPTLISGPYSMVRKTTSETKCKLQACVLLILLSLVFLMSMTYTPENKDGTWKYSFGKGETSTKPIFGFHVNFQRCRHKIFTKTLSWGAMAQQGAYSLPAILLLSFHLARSAEKSIGIHLPKGLTAAGKQGQNSIICLLLIWIPLKWVQFNDSSKMEPKHRMGFQWRKSSYSSWSHFRVNNVKNFGKRKNYGETIRYPSYLTS